MKKLTSIALLLTIVLSLSACNTAQKVSIYIPDTVTEYTGESDTPASVSYLLYPEDWETAESFTVSYSADGKTPIEGGTVVIHTKNQTTTVANEVETDEYFDEKGQVVSRNTLQERSLQVTQSVFSYDSNGRVLSRITATSIAGDQETYLPQVSFIYEETEQGSRGVGEEKGYSEIYCYDKQYRLVSYAVEIMGLEGNRTEYVYDANGNVTEELIYVDGELSARYVTTYKIVEVEQTAADRLLQFKRVK